MGTLVGKVEQRVAESDAYFRDPTLFTAELKAALKLNDLFEYVKPEEYVLPLDALAGFCMGSRVTFKHPK